MFGFKKKAEDKGEEVMVSVQTIPTDFYGGANPVVTFKTVKKEVDLTKRQATLSASEKAAHEKAHAVGGTQPLHPANIFSQRKYVVVAGIGLFVIAVGAAGFYYWWQQRRAGTPRRQPQPVVTTTPTTTAMVAVPTTTVETTMPTITVTSTEIQPPAPPTIEFPSLLLADTEDMDNDDITDVAEELFGTDPGKPDFDDDKYTDGQEVYNLYNPAGKEPIRLIESGAVREFNNPTFGYRLYHPASWVMGTVDNEYRDVLFTSLTGESIEVAVFDRQPGQDFATWFGVHAGNERYVDLVPFDTGYKEQGWRRKDYLTYYFTDDRHVYFMLYRPAPNALVTPYRMIIKMMARSFRFPASAVTELPMPIVETSAPVESATSASL